MGARAARAAVVVWSAADCEARGMVAQVGPRAEAVGMLSTIRENRRRPAVVCEAPAAVARVAVTMAVKTAGPRAVAAAGMLCSLASRAATSPKPLRCCDNKCLFLEE